MTTPGILIGVDVGSSVMSGGLVTVDGEILRTTQIPTHRDGPGTALGSLDRVLGELLREAVLRGLRIEGIGIGLAGLVDADAGALRKGIERYPELAALPLAERLQAQTGCPVFLDNDVNALALGEWTWGLGRGTASMIVLALGTGAGAGLILDGRVVRGRTGCAGEFGHVCIHLDGRPCVCGARGCLGAYAAGFGIATEWRRRNASAAYPAPGGGPLEPGDRDRWDHDAEPVFRRAAEGDPLASALIEEACHALGAGLATLVNGLNPELIVVTGGIAIGLTSHERRIRDHVAAYALAPALEGTRIEFVPGHKSQTVRGGAALFLYEQSRRAGVR